MSVEEPLIQSGSANVGAVGGVRGAGAGDGAVEWATTGGDDDGALPRMFL